MEIVYGIGVDVGGTNTDAVLMEFPSKNIIGHVKTYTTKDFQTGVVNSIQSVLNISKVNKDLVKVIIIGTTTFINAIVQRSHELQKVSIFRLCGPATQGYPPYVDFPKDLKKVLEQKNYFLSGGHEYDGKELSPLNESEIVEKTNELIQYCKDNNLKEVNIAIVGTFSPSNTSHEEKAQEIMEPVLQQSGLIYNILQSHKISHLGFLERESAAILNLSLKKLARKAISSLGKAIKKLELKNYNLFLTQNDGSIINSKEAIQYPIFTFSSGPTNSLRGAFQLSGNIQNAIVVDIGGTTTDFAVIQKGFPRENQSFAKVGGVRTNFRMPDTYSIGLGGGSIIRFQGQEVFVGPQSVGYNLAEKSKCFGGDTLTPTDIAIKLGYVQIPGADAQKVDVTEEQIQKIYSKIHQMIEVSIDKMKTTNENIDLILVGGGACFIPKDFKLEGISNIVRPQYLDVANAIGAAISQVSGSINQIIKIEEREKLLPQLKQKAKDLAIQSGGKAETCQVLSLLEVPQTYYAGGTERVQIKVIAELDFMKFQIQEEENLEEEIQVNQEKFEGIVFCEDIFKVNKIAEKNIVKNGEQEEWLLNETDVEYIATGAAILGTGGGGSNYLGSVMLRKILAEGKKIRIIQNTQLENNKHVIYCGFMGAPMVISEKLARGTEILDSTVPLRERYDVQAITATEIGGINSTMPLYVAALTGLPCVDSDFMGRAFPRLEMITPCMYGRKITPVSIADEKGNCIVQYSVKNNNPVELENSLRSICVSWGCIMGISLVIKSEDLKKIGIHGSFTRAWKLGKAIHEAAFKFQDPIQAIISSEDAQLIFQGKTIDVYRIVDAGYNKGYMKIEGINDFKGWFLKIEIQNENLIAKLFDNQSCQGDFKLLAVVPDLISVLDIDTSQAILTEDMKYGLRVNVIKIDANTLIKTEKGLKLVGPKAFGYMDIDYEAVPEPYDLS